MIFRVNHYSSNLKRSAKNIWIPIKGNNSKTAYPKSGHSNCFAIEDSSFWFKHRNNCIIALLRNYQPNGPIFDIGGGNGYVTGALCQEGFKSVLVEPGNSGIKNAKIRKIPFLIQSTFEDANFYPNSIPAIGLFDVLEHIEDDISFLRKIQSVLKPNGKLYMTVPAFSFLWSNQDIYAHHFRRYTRSNISKILRLAKFSIDYCTYYFTIFPIPLLLFRAIPFRLNKTQKYTDSQFQEEMTKSTGIFEYFLKSYLKFELNRIKKKSIFPLGSSILLVAHK